MSAFFSITKNDVFRFNREMPGALFTYQFLFSAEEIEYDILGQDVTIDRIQREARSVFTFNAYVATISPLKNVTSSQHRKRRNYLVRIILEKYDNNDPEVMRDLFMDGTGGN